MATRVRARSPELCEQDFYAWAREQADLLRAGRFEELDFAHLTAEIDDLGESLYRSVRSRIRTIIEHLLKLEHSPAAEPRSLWLDTIQTQRADLEDDLKASLRRRLRSDCRSSTCVPALRPRVPCAATARPRPPTPCPRLAPTPSTRSPATGCRRRRVLFQPVRCGRTSRARRRSQRRNRRRRHRNGRP